MIKRKNKIDKANLISNIILLASSFAFIIPLVMILIASFTSEASLEKNGFSFIPQELSLEAYALLFKNSDVMLKSALLTAIISIIAPLVSCIVSMLAGYAVSNENWVFKNFFSYFLLVTMVFSAGILPTYIITTKYYHLGNNIFLYFIHGLTNAWSIILFKTFYKGVPTSLIESARLDGCTELQCLIYILAPMTKTIFAMQYVLGIINKWNDFQTSLIYMTERSLQTIQHVLQRALADAQLLAQAYADYNVSAVFPLTTMRYAMCIFSVMPIIILFPFASKNFTKGISVGSVKG